LCLGRKSACVGCEGIHEALRLGRIYDWNNESRVHGFCVNKIHSGDTLVETPIFTASDPFAPTSHCWPLAPLSVTIGSATDIYGIGKREPCHSTGKSSYIQVEIDVIMRRTAGCNATWTKPKDHAKDVAALTRTVHPADWSSSMIAGIHKGIRWACHPRRDAIAINAIVVELVDASTDERCSRIKQPYT
jgi:hypothetical protein